MHTHMLTMTRTCHVKVWDGESIKVKQRFRSETGPDSLAGKPQSHRLLGRTKQYPDGGHPRSPRLVDVAVRPFFLVVPCLTGAYDGGTVERWHCGLQRGKMPLHTTYIQISLCEYAEREMQAAKKGRLVLVSVFTADYCTRGVIREVSAGSGDEQ